MANLGEGTGRSIWRIRNKLKMIRLGGPFQRRVIFNKLASKTIHDVACLHPLGNTAPAKMKRDHRSSGGAAREKVRQTEEIPDRQIVHVDGSLSITRMDRHAAAVDWDRPEHTVGCDARIKIMDLI